MLNNNSDFKIRNWFDAILSSALLISMLVALSLSQFVGIPIWVITLGFAIIFILEDIIFGIFYILKEKSLSKVQLQKGLDVYGIPENKNEFWIAIKRVPWKILPFIIVFFIFVQGLNDYGVVDYFATLMSQLSTSVGAGIAVNGIFGLILANLINNQPMTIFLSNVLVSESFVVSDLIFKSSAYAVVIASNLAASITLLGALAGLMWKKILNIKGLEVTYFDFLKKGLVITPLVFVATLVTLYFVLT